MSALEIRDVRKNYGSVETLKGSLAQIGNRAFARQFCPRGRIG